LTSAARFNVEGVRIGELAERTGVTTRALRHYEDIGLLPVRRAVNGYRTYDTADERIVAQIRSLVEIGFALEETRPFVDCLRDGHDSGDSCTPSLLAYREKMGEIEACIARLQDAHARLARQLHEALMRHPLAAADPACTYHSTEGAAS
jgi:DNA-binding transcriptional MerR regulator